MSDAPDRIFLWPESADVLSRYNRPGKIEYIRADLAPKWVSVDERLPEPYQKVTVTDGVNVCGGIYYDEGGKEDGFPYKWANDEGLPFKGVTRWMPLPPPPENENA